jgi:hypothetical protein
MRPVKTGSATAGNQSYVAYEGAVTIPKLNVAQQAANQAQTALALSVPSETLPILKDLTRVLLRKGVTVDEPMVAASNLAC